MLKDVVKNSVSPLLKQHGFKKKGMKWNKSLDHYVQVVDFQSSRNNIEGEGTFTINLGVFDPEIWMIVWEKDVPKFINETDCFPRIRIGQLLNLYSAKWFDKWWEYNSNSEMENLGKEISCLLETKCLPFLDTMLSSQEVDKLYSSNSINLMPMDKIYLAVLKRKLGFLASSNVLLDDVGSISESWAYRVEIVRKNLLNV